MAGSTAFIPSVRRCRAVGRLTSAPFIEAEVATRVAVEFARFDEHGSTKTGELHAALLCVDG